MTRRHRPELFPVDRALQARMLLAIAASAGLGIVVFGALAVLAIGSWDGAVFLFLYVGMFAGFNRFFAGVYIRGVPYPDLDDDSRYHGVEPEPEERLRATVHRLCLLSDVPVPGMSVYPVLLPQSYTVAPLRGRPTVYVSAGMMRVLDDRELDAVVAHELSHIANRDAALMTWLTTPSSLFGGSIPDLWRGRRRSAESGSAAATLTVLFLPVVVYVTPFVMAITASTRLLSRHRELYADRCAAVLTGSPAVVATTLMKISGERAALDLPDLRVIGGARDEFHILPDRPQPTGLRRIWATHPPVPVRTARLGDMERELQGARLSRLVE